MGNDSATSLPMSLAVAWGLRERPAKGPKRGLSLDRIVEAAVQVAAADGLTAVSMSRVAAELGVSTMSLYRYVSAKNELLLLMEDAAYADPPPRAAPEEGWRTAISDWARAQRAVFQRNPWVVRIPISAPPSTPNSVAWMEHGLVALHGTGLGEAEKLSVMMLISGFVRNEVTLMLDITEAAAASGATPGEAHASWARLLAKLADAERFPAVTAALREGALDTAGGPDDEFVFGLERILDGVEVLVSARREAPGPAPSAAGADR